MRRKNNDNGTSKFLLTLLTLCCIVLIAVSFLNQSVSAPVRRITGTVIQPMQKGINTFGSWLYDLTANISDSASLREQISALQDTVDTLTAENSQLVLDKEELSRLKELLELDNQYSDYEKIGARVISKDSGNWFSSFTIDKGTEDGIQADCNVLAGAGLAGIVTEAGPNWAIVRSIIDDNSNVSAMVSNTSDTCIIAGNLKLIDEGTISLVKLRDENNKVHVGDKVVTSNISEKFLPGILIGHIVALDNDSNNLTKSGQITPVVDFKHLQEVLVILERKEYVASPDDKAASQQVINDVAKEEPVREDDNNTDAIAEDDLLTAPRNE